ncbi:hypothetical protein HN873_036281, partial [Arachis hypogaea]
FIHEARNSERAAKNLRNNKLIRVPHVFWDLTSRQVLTMQFYTGRKLLFCYGLMALSVLNFEFVIRRAQIPAVTGTALAAPLASPPPRLLVASALASNSVSVISLLPLLPSPPRPSARRRAATSSRQCDSFCSSRAAWEGSDRFFEGGDGHEWEKAEARERRERLEEWKAAEEERRLEKVVEEFLKKQMKKGKKVAGDGEAHKYVAKYREESERCVAEVAESVKEALKSLNGKRKGSEAALEKADSKKMGKRKLNESDSDLIHQL